MDVQTVVFKDSTLLLVHHLPNVWANRSFPPRFRVENTILWVSEWVSFHSDSIKYMKIQL